MKYNKKACIIIRIECIITGMKFEIASAFHISWDNSRRPLQIIFINNNNKVVLLVLLFFSIQMDPVWKEVMCYEELMTSSVQMLMWLKINDVCIYFHLFPISFSFLYVDAMRNLHYIRVVHMVDLTRYVWCR